MRHSFRRWFLCALLLAPAACASDEPPAGEVDIEAAVRSAVIPAELAQGETAFAQNCAACHGERALGTEQGPPLVHIYYEPNHHADIAFQFAVERGVRAHHWGFGDMPPQPQVSAEQTAAITRYVRFLQQEADIF
jgi:mono/diheme cytochrome c family protein